MGEQRSGKTFPTINPSTGEEIAAISEADEADVNKAVKAARAAFEKGPWRKMSAAERGHLMYKLADLIEEHADELARLEALDNGKPAQRGEKRRLGWRLLLIAITQAGLTRFRAKRSHWRRLLQLYPSRASRSGGADHPMEFSDPDAVLEARSSPGRWQYRRDEAGRADAADGSSHRRIGLEAGFPEGVVNILPGYGPTAGAAISSHMDIDKVAFTGSTEVGKLIMKAAAAPQLEAGDAGTRRQESEHRFCGCRHGSSGGRLPLRSVLQSGPVLLRRFPPNGRGERLRRVC